jgi:hypothetical protein
MELQRANEVLKSFTDDVSTVNAEISRQNYKINRMEGFEEKNKELQKEVQRLREIERVFNLVKNFTTVEVCPQCDGHGGFVHDMGEAGYEGEECTNCETTGLIAKYPNPELTEKAAAFASTFGEIGSERYDCTYEGYLTGSLSVVMGFKHINTITGPIRVDTNEGRCDLK